MADSRCPEPKPVAIFLLILAGTAGGAAIGALARMMVHDWVSATSIEAVTGGCLLGAAMGISIGLTLGLSHRFWLRMVLAPALGAAVTMAALKVQLNVFDWLNPFQQLAVDVLTPFGGFLSAFRPLTALADTTGVWGLFFGAPAGLGMLLAHQWHLVHRRWVAALPVHVVGGALGFSFFWHDLYWNSSLHRSDVWPSIPLIPRGWALGAVFGLVQFAGLLAALAVDRKLRSRIDPPPSSPSPGPGP